MELRGKRVLIMGLGLHGSGIASARYAAQQGAQVRVTDLRPAEVLAPSIAALAGLHIEYILGQHRDEDFAWAEIVLRVPGVKRTSPYLRIAREHGAQIEQEIALFFSACPGRIIGVTGTRGKTTTSTLLYELIKASGQSTVLGGNVSGVETLSLLPTITAQTQVVLELSSWQLEALEPHNMSPAVALMTNIYPDHLDTYDGMEDYAAAKANIFRHQKPGDLAIFNYDNEWTRRMGESAPAERTWFSSLERGGSFQRSSDELIPFLFRETALPGAHNLENILLATTAARLLGISDETIARVVREFHGVPHRLQEIAVIDGVRYINDTTSTTPVAAEVALRAFDGPIVLVAGGNTKHLPLAGLPAAILQSCRDLILLTGSGSDELLPALEAEAQARHRPNPLRGTFDNFSAAMDAAVALTRPGDILLFSPGFTSFGMFLNEFDRGDKFVAYVEGLKG
ncbi:MAG TPA: UDP-N-acetylmuramoyl-L-alanine--D-glutamate ligase [Ktedonobacteraceae bacterium]